MPLPGGAADKFGALYEGRRTVYAMLDILEGRANSIRLEPPGEEGRGVEFWMRTDQGVEYCQVKRQLGSEGHWSIAALKAAGVLAAFLARLNADESAECVFVSTHSADQLDELVHRAIRAASWNEFVGEFLKGTEISRGFKRLQETWGTSDQETLSHLRRLRIETVDAETLDRYLLSRLTTLVDGDPKAALSVLAGLVLEKVHQELSADDLWNELTNCGFARRNWLRDDSVNAAVAATVAQFELRHEHASIGGYKIERMEAKAVVDKITDENHHQDVLVVSVAGGGKSQVLLQAVELLKNMGWPTLALSIDRLVPTTLPDNVGEQLGLPASPARTLGGVAAGRPCVLVIDQLDAVSLASGRQTAFYDVIREIIAQAKTYAGMKVLLACRRFDLDNDHRIRKLSEGKDSAEVIAVDELDRTIVIDVIKKLGIDPAPLRERQLSLLSNPLHLSLFAEVASDGNPIGFQSAKDLFDLFWDRKQVAVAERLGGPAHFANVVDALSDWMSANQVLFAPYSLTDDWPGDASAMTSEHVLVRVDSRGGFFHESFFDYAFARRFIARGHDVHALLMTSEQHLFRRAQVRQVLVHERDSVRDQYLDHLSQVLLTPDIRLHIKEVVIGLLAATDDPTEDEWSVLDQIDRAKDEPMWSVLWRTLSGKDRWFELLCSLGVIQSMLSGGDEGRVNLGVQLVRAVQRSCPDQVSRLLRPYVGVSHEWNQRLRWLMEWAEPDSSREFLDLFLDLLDSGVLDETRGPIAVNSDFWSLLIAVPNRHPGWCCEVVRHYLDRRLEMSLEAGQSNPFDSTTGTIPASGFHDSVIEECAQREPRVFVDSILPFMLRVIALNLEPSSAGPARRDPIWCYRMFGGGHGLDDRLLMAIEGALRTLAATDPSYIADLVMKLRGIGSETIQYLIIRTYAANAALFANAAVGYLMESPDRLNTGYLSDSHWAARELIESASAHCSDENLAALEQLLLNYYSEWENTAEGRRARGHAQFELLGGIAIARRSDEVSRRLEQLSRRFGRLDVAPPEPVRVHTVGSPIPASAAERMSDDQWIGAMRRYSRHTEGGFDDMKGGPHELSQVLESEAKSDPERFAKLTESMPDDVNSGYFEAILRAVTNSSLSVERVAELCRRCHRIPSRPTGRWLCRLVQSLAPSDQIPDDLLDFLVWYAINDPDPEEDIWKTKPDWSDSPYYSGDPVNAGLNSARGSALLAIAVLIFYRPARSTQLLPALEHAAIDPLLSVRAWGIEALRALLMVDRDRAVGLAISLLDTEEAIFRASTVEQFLHDALPTHYEALNTVLRRMLASEVPEIAQAGARQATLASLTVKDAGTLATSCLSGTIPQRKGAAEVFAANLGSADHREFCEISLCTLFSDSDEDVRTEAATCFRHLGVQPISDYESLVDAFLQTPAFGSNFHDLILTLDHSELPLPDFTWRVCRRFMEAAGAESGDIRTRTAGTAMEVSRLTLRLYSQTGEEAVRSRCLDVVDSMTSVGTFGLDKAIESFER